MKKECPLIGKTWNFAWYCAKGLGIDNWSLGVVQASKVKRTSERLHLRMTLKVILIIIVILTNFTTLMMNVVSLMGNATTLVLDAPNTNKESTKKGCHYSSWLWHCRINCNKPRISHMWTILFNQKIITMKTQRCSIKSFLTLYMTFYMLSISCMLFLKSSNDSPK